MMTFTSIVVSLIHTYRKRADEYRNSRVYRVVSAPLINASHAARRVACHGVRSHPVPVALVGECSILIRLKCGSRLIPHVIHFGHSS
jgi:hypothetical protein